MVSDPAYDAVADSVFSSNAKSSEYLTISRPDGGRGTVTISNTGGLDTFVGSYYLEIRATHQDVTTVKRLTHTGYKCDITYTVDSSTFNYNLGTGSATYTINLSYNTALCPAIDSSRIVCSDQDFCDNYVSYEVNVGSDPLVNQIVVNAPAGAIAGGTVSAVVTINNG